MTTEDSADDDRTPQQGPHLEECPDCGGDRLVPADEVNEDLWTDEDTACRDCEVVWDARRRFNGGFNNDVAAELSQTTEGDTNV